MAFCACLKIREIHFKPFRTLICLNLVSKGFHLEAYQVTQALEL